MNAAEQLRADILDALRGVELAHGIRSRVPYGRFADAVLALGAVRPAGQQPQHTTAPKTHEEAA